MPPFLKDHIIVSGRTTSLPYTSISSGRSPVEPRTWLDRRQQGNDIQGQFESAIANSVQGQDSNFVYLVFKSAIGFFLDLDKFDKTNYRIASYKKIEITQGDETSFILEVAVYLNKSAISEFLTKVEQYISEDTPAGNPKHLSLIANIEEIRAATLESFWQEPELPFPDRGQEQWWEIWLSRDNSDDPENPIAPFNDLLTQAGIQTGKRYLKFPEHWVYLMKGTVEQLASSLLYINKLAEVRKPRDTADFFTYMDRQEQVGWLDDLNNRVTYITDTNISVCLLDTGVNRINPLLQNIIQEKNLDTVNPNWLKNDSNQHGHGTSMAGLILYGDLIDVLGTSSQVQIYHHLESVKLIQPDDPHDPELYGAVTQEAIARGVILNPDNKRIICMAVTTNDVEHKGRPSSWSSAIDQSIFGSATQPNDNTLFIVSSGNLAWEERINYPLSNTDASIQDPAQAFNAITVGAYTLKDRIVEPQHSGADIMAQRGAMAPCNTTSFVWEKDWCRKPDIVMEGGNHGLYQGDTIAADSLQLLSTSKGGIGKPWLTSFGDTSASTALASGFAGELYHNHPEYWPETIRGLIVHSADWTPSMLANKNINQLTLDEKLKLITHVGYGVPNMQRARYSANNSLSLIAERTLKPYKLEDSIVKTNEFHLFDLPWPTEVLQQLFNTPVKLSITLSYFIEPNPGSKRYELSASYRSHGLRFKIIDAGESDDRFRARVSKAMRDEDYTSEGGEHWILGSPIRDKGSIHKDIWQGVAVDLTRRNKIAIHPVGGWWKSRKNQNRFDNLVRYSLIITIETPSTDIDIYTPVLNQISIEI